MAAGKIALVAVVVAALVAVAAAKIGFDNCNMHFYNGFIPFQEKKNVQLCMEEYYATSYDNDMVNPLWSANLATVDHCKHPESGRIHTFKENKDLEDAGVDQAPVHSEIWGEVKYNKGHLNPSHIMSYTKPAETSTYIMSNVAPQYGSFNQQQWAELERLVMDWVATNETNLYVITGLGYNDRSNADRPYDNIAVPDYYWKAICDPTNNQSAAFIGANNKSADGTYDFQPVSAVENLIGGPVFDPACNTTNVDPTYWFDFPDSN